MSFLHGYRLILTSQRFHQNSHLKQYWWWLWPWDDDNDYFDDGISGDENEADLNGNLRIGAYPANIDENISWWHNNFFWWFMITSFDDYITNNDIVDNENEKGMAV